MSEIWTSMVFRHSISVQFPNISNFRHCLKSKFKVCLSDTFFQNVSEIWAFKFGFQSILSNVWDPNPQLGFQTRHIGVSKIWTYKRVDFSSSDFRHLLFFDFEVKNDPKNINYWSKSKKLLILTIYDTFGLCIMNKKQDGKKLIRPCKLNECWIFLNNIFELISELRPCFVRFNGSGKISVQSQVT